MRARLFPIPFALWLVVTVAWFLGAEGVSVPTRTGQVATIDFNRKYDHTAHAVAPGVALIDDELGELVRVKAAWIPYCWLCGRNLLDGPIMQSATHRRGPWIYRVPGVDPNFTGWTNPRGIAAALTLAFNVETGERVSADRGSPLEARISQLGARGLDLDDVSRIDPSKLAPVSLLSEGCAIVQSAFFVVLPLWSLGFGVVLLVRRRRRPR
jgi:hypothetical protein